MVRQGNSRLMIVVPCYNEQEVLPECVKQLSAIVDELEKQLAEKTTPAEMIEVLKAFLQ